MATLDRLREWWRDAFDTPIGGGGFHLWWHGLPADEAVVECSVTLEVIEAPRVPTLYFWALQASFTDGASNRYGSAHLGLQWNSRYPEGRAVNWGGYAQPPAGAVFSGTDSPLPSAPRDANTRDYRWRDGAPYRLRIHRADVGWAGSITDLEEGSTVTVRQLRAGGDRLVDMVMWTELFGQGDDPGTAVRWSVPEGLTAAGQVVRPRAVKVDYNAGRQWRRQNTSFDGVGFVQATDQERTVRPQTVLPVPTPSVG